MGQEHVLYVRGTTPSQTDRFMTDTMGSIDVLPCCVLAELLEMVQNHN